MAVGVRLTGIRNTETKAPDEEHIDARISGVVQFEITIAGKPIPVHYRFKDCPGELMAKARAFDQLNKLVGELRGAIAAARAANGL